MQCANPQCRKELIYLSKGRLEAHELEIPSREGLPLDSGFPAKSGAEQILLALWGVPENALDKTVDDFRPCRRVYRRKVRANSDAGRWRVRCHRYDDDA
jgi:hypothetical protein